MSELKLYKCHKEVHAKQMYKGDYNNARDRQVPGNQDDEGYLVIYNQGTDDHYESWSPRRAFEEGYILSQTFIDRLEIERGELSEKTEKLGAFLSSERFEELASKDAEDLIFQSQLMKKYLEILDKRLDRFNDRVMGNISI